MTTTLTPDRPLGIRSKKIANGEPYDACLAWLTLSERHAAEDNAVAELTSAVRSISSTTASVMESTPEPGVHTPTGGGVARGRARHALPAGPEQDHICSALRHNEIDGEVRFKTGEGGDTFSPD